MGKWKMRYGQICKDGICSSGNADIGSRGGKCRSGKKSGADRRVERNGKPNRYYTVRQP